LLAENKKDTRERERERERQRERQRKRSIFANATERREKGNEGRKSPVMPTKS
jgi:hypothetical protein